MSKFLLRIGVLLCLIASARVCKSQDRGTASAPSADWTVMVYMNAKNNLECDALENFKQMATVGSSQSVHVLAEMGRPKVVIVKGVRRSHYRCGDKDPWDGVLRFHVEKNQVAVPASAVKNLGQADMGSASTLTDFVGWGRTSYPAKHYMLVIWNHGQGWRFQTARNQALKAAAASKRPGAVTDDVRRAMDSEGTPSVGGFRSVSFDDETGHFLYNRDIQDSLGKLLSGQKLDVIGFDACLMAMVETGYALRSVGTVMVASEELVPGLGWDYGDLLKQLEASSGGTDAKKMGQILVESYKQEYQDIHKTTLSAVDLSEVETFAGAISDLAKVMKTNLKAEAANIATARAKCLNYGEDADFTNPIDVRQFAAALVATSQNPDIQTSARNVIAAVDGHRFVFANYASARSKEGYGSFGVSIFFPKSKADFDADPDKDGYVLANRSHEVEFVRAQDWSGFLAAYLNLPAANGGKE